MSSGSNPSSMQPQNDSANNSYNGSPAPTIYMSSASYAYHTRYNTVDTQTTITSTSNLSIGETSQVDYQWDSSSLIPTMFDYRQIEVTQSDYPRYLVIDGDSTPGQYSSYTAPTSTRAYNDGYNYVQTVYEEAIEQTTTQTRNETTTPPSPTTVRWASEYQSHEARALGLSPPPNKCASQNRKEGIPTGDMFSSGSSAKSSRSRKKSKST